MHQIELLQKMGIGKLHTLFLAISILTLTDLEKHRKDTRIIRYIDLVFFVALPIISAASAVIAGGVNKDDIYAVGSCLNVVSLGPIFIRCIGRCRQIRMSYHEQVAFEYRQRNDQISSRCKGSPEINPVVFIMSCVAIGYAFANLKDDPLASKLLLTAGFIGVLQGIAPTIETKE